MSVQKEQILFPHLLHLREAQCDIKGFNLTGLASEKVIISFVAGPVWLARVCVFTQDFSHAVETVAKT